MERRERDSSERKWGEVERGRVHCRRTRRAPLLARGSGRRASDLIRRMRGRRAAGEAERERERE